MKLFHACGLVKSLAVEDVSDDALVALTDFCEAFLKCGALTLSDWIGLSEIERACMVTAAGRIEAERAASYGIAAQGPMQALEILSGYDGGDAKYEALTELMAQKLKAKTEKAHFDKTGKIHESLANKQTAKTPTTR